MKRFIISACILLISSIAFCFDWPQEKVVQSDQFYSYFGQLRGETISNSLIFSEISDVKAADDGYLTVIISEYSDHTDFFPSTLGNAVILSHTDNLLTVYGNIDSESILKEAFNENSIKCGETFGTSGNSAWQQGHSSLEFQVIDTKNNTSINPRLLMPRVGKELPLYYNEIYLQGKNGRQYNVTNQNILPSGIYKVYKKRQAVAVPYRTRVAINGTVVDQISYDLLRQDDNQICVSGRKNYSKSILYPNNDLQLLGEATLTPGKNALQLTITDILGKEVNATYLLTIH
ncbi:MAG: M23 family metallopeptidase [Treponema sp.]|nr:M23 family metallopeptidase [Treponema sp.]